ncbi:hypothetical protein RSAG8_07510, partial [Rhizoctonia solani AG-8 WAC10335]
PPSPEYFAFGVDHSYIFCSAAPCVMYTYIPRRDLRLGYFDGTSAATLEGPRDLQDIAFNDRFVPTDEYDPWVHAVSMCIWAKQVGLDGIARMEPSFEVILCNIDSDLQLVSSQELVYHETMIFPGQRIPGGPNVTSSAYPRQHPRLKTNTPYFPGPTIPVYPPPPGWQGKQRTFAETMIFPGQRIPGGPNATSSADPRQHPRLKTNTPYFPGPTIPVYPPPPGWQGKQRTFADTTFEAIRAGMWHNHFPGESRIILDYSGIVSAYDETYASLVRGRQGVPRSKHRLGGISTGDMSRLKAEMEEVLKADRLRAVVEWRLVFQDIVNRYAERLEDLRYLLGRSDIDPEKVVASARQKILVMLTPYMAPPQSKPNSAQANIEEQQPLHTDSYSASRNKPDDDWFTRIYNACAKHLTVEFARTRTLTTQEARLANSIDVVQGAICSSLTAIWAEAFESADKPLLARHMIAKWKTEVEELMGWLDWHVWVKCDPPCGPGTIWVMMPIETWPWDVQTGDEDIGPMCKDHMGDDAY